jgi:hypothetical protein
MMNNISFPSIPYLPSGRAASSPQRSCVWRNLTLFDGTSQGCLCGDWYFFYFPPYEIFVKKIEE